jgi:protein-S-isoprenylcysteine O-methyltransferase Ste14
MSLIPAFKIGIWNAWILQVIFYLSMFIPDFFLDKEAKIRSKRMSMFAPYKKIEKLLALSSHVVIMPLVFIYSLFLPLKIGSAWLYVGLPIFAVSILISVTTIFNIATSSIDKPVTKGAYRISRHPMYFSGFLMFISIAISCASWVVFLCGALWLVIWQIVVPTEERLLIEKYGDAYRDYVTRTPRWIGIPKKLH